MGRAILEVKQKDDQTGLATLEDKQDDDQEAGDQEAGDHSGG